MSKSSENINNLKPTGLEAGISTNTSNISNLAVDTTANTDAIVILESSAVTVAATAPTSPVEGQLWVDTSV